MNHTLIAALAVAIAVACGPVHKTDPTVPTGETEITDEPTGDAAEQPTEEEKQIAAIAAAINEFSRPVHSCWAMAAADDFRVEGQVVLRVELGEGGAAAKITVVTDDPNDPVLTDCLTKLWSDYRWPPLFRAGDVIQLPPLLFVAPDAQYTVAEAHVPPVKLGNDSSWVKVLLDHANTGNRAAAMSLLSISGGLEVPMHRHTSAELLYVLSGAGVIYGLDGAKKGTKVTAGSAIYIVAGTAHGFIHKGNDPVVLVQLYAPGGPEARFRGKPTNSTTAVSPKEQRRRGRTRGKFAKPLVVETSGPPPLSIADGKADIRILFDRSSAGDDAAYLGTLSGKPGLEVPLHIHETSTELLYLIEGEGTMVVGDITIEVQAGDAIQIPPGVWHSFKSGASELKALQFYTPSGPEQRFRGTSK